MTKKISQIQYRVALSLMRGVTPDFIRHLENSGITPEDFFNLTDKELIATLDLKPPYNIVDRYKRDEAIFRSRIEVEKMEHHKITGLFLGDDNYPWRLENLPDAPVMIYVLGDADLNFLHPISIVGTRRCTAAGLEFTSKFVSDLGGYFNDLCVISGLAYGIDAEAHKAALQNGLKTVAVVAHGLDTLYPAAHRELAKSIIRSGGAILSEYPFGTKPFRGHFLQRNRIVAGLSDAITIVESEIKGGAMSTASLAFNYNKDVFAVPGRVSDLASSGCNHLIRRHKANLLTSAADVIEITDWTPIGISIPPGTRSLFPEIEGDAKKIYDYLRFSSEPQLIDSIHHNLHIPMAPLMSLLSELEFDGIITKLPGNRYELSL